MKKTRTIATVILAAAMLPVCMTSCSGTKNLIRPQIDMPSQIVPGESGADSLCAADMDWWKFYTDSTLCYIISETLDHNRDFMSAAARVEELRQLYGVDKLCYMPIVTGVAGATRETNHYHDEKYSLDVETDFKATLNWEVDLWGGLSAARRRSAARFMASVEDMRAMQITLVSQAATAYFNLVAFENELNIVRRTLATREEAREKARLRFEGGLTSEIVYQQAQVEYATTAALIPGLERRIDMARNAITLLMGRFPSERLDGMTIHYFEEELSLDMPVGLPSQLLERRPDLRAAEQNLRAALEGCGVAYSNQFPKLRLAITGGWENDDFVNLFKSPFTYMLGNITGTIFDFGRNRRKYKASIAAYEQARFSYEKAVMAAFTEVADAAVTYRSSVATVDSRRQLRDAAYKYVTLANKQYIGGTINYIDVLDAHRRYFDAQINYSNAVRDRYLAIAALYRALGGGWNGQHVVKE